MRKAWSRKCAAATPEADQTDSARAAHSAVGADPRRLVVAAIGSYPYYGTNQYVLSLLGKFLCYSIFALSVDLIWGFAGILSLGQAVYFGIGAYFVALSLKINYALDPSDALWRQHPGFHGVERPDGASGIHGAADQHAVRCRLRAGDSDASRFHFRRHHLQAHISMASIAR